MTDNNSSKTLLYFKVDAMVQGIALVFRGEKGAKLKGKVIQLLFCRCTNPHLCFYCTNHD